MDDLQPLTVEGDTWHSRLLPGLYSQFFLRTFGSNPGQKKDFVSNESTTYGGNTKSTQDFT